MISLSRKAGGEFDTHVEPSDRFAVAARVMNDARVIHDWYAECLCASPNGARVYFEDNTGRFLITDGKLEKIGIAE
jgi:hypothetical protein